MRVFKSCKGMTYISQNEINRWHLLYLPDGWHGDLHGVTAAAGKMTKREAEFMVRLRQICFCAWHREFVQGQSAWTVIFVQG